MVARQRDFGLRRLKLEELITKLAQIEEQASTTLREFPHGLTVERQRLIVGIAKQVRSHLEDQLRRGSRVAVLESETPQEFETEANHLKLVDRKSASGANG